MKRKLLVITLILLVVLTGCTTDDKEEKYGGFDDVDVSEDVKESGMEMSPFAPIKSGYYESYQSVNSGLSELSFDVPLGWQVTCENARRYRIETKDDPVLKDRTMYVLFSLDPYTDYHDEVENFDYIFSDETRFLYYSIGSERYYEVYDDAPISEKYVDKRLETEELTSCNIRRNVHTSDAFSRSARTKLTSLRYSVLWNEVPVQLRMLVGESEEEAAKEILSEVVSSFRTYSYPTSSTIEAKFDGLNINIPKEFTQISYNGEKIYKASENIDSPFSGMMIMQRDMSVNPKEEHNKVFDEFSKAANIFLPKSKFDVILNEVIESPVDMTIARRNVSFYYDNLSVFKKGKDDPGYYGKQNAALILLYAYPTGNEYKGIYIYSVSGQTEGMDRIMDCMAKAK